MNEAGFGVLAFSEMLGVSRQSLSVATKKGKIGKIKLVKNKFGKKVSHNTYTVADLESEYAKEKLELKGGGVKSLPHTAIEEIYDIKIDEKRTQEKKDNIKSVKSRSTKLPITTMEQLELIPNGLMDKPILPLAGLTSYGRMIWKATIGDLIDLEVLNKADLMTLKNYCAVQAQVHDMEIELLSIGYYMDGRINPLIGAVSKARLESKVIAQSLGITIQGRKGFTTPKKSSKEEDAWSKVLN